VFAHSLANVIAAIPTPMRYRMAALKPVATAVMRMRQPVAIVRTAAGELRWGPDHLTSQRFLRGTYESYMQQAFMQHVRPGMVVYDVGAHAGFHSLFCGLLVRPDGRVIGFEPHPRNRRSAERQAALNPNLPVSFSPYALSDRCGRVLLDTRRNSSQACVCPQGDMAVEARTVDWLVQHERFPSPDVLKIDVEGHELQVLEGCIETLTRKHPLVLCDHNDASTLPGVAALLSPLGYRVVDAPPIVAVPEWYRQQPVFDPSVVGRRDAS
jgi:FkbM family methyltransferase